MYISDASELQAFIARARTSDILAIDTEFLREKTYYPRLCLLQMATEQEDVIVDPFTVGPLDCLVELLENPAITKLFHSGSQDIEIIYHELGTMPQPLFDTQIAAALLGHTLQIGYGSLVQSECGVTLKKGDSFTDWSRRPLSKSQLEYAADDVIYLPALYRSMAAKLDKLGRLEWLDADFKELCDPERYQANPRERYKKLKRVHHLSMRQLSAAREVTAWREEKAMRSNVPRKWVMSDEHIVEACKREPRSVDELFMVRGLREKLSTEDARSVLAAIQTGVSLPRKEWPQPERPSRNEANVEVEVDALSAILRLRAKENDIAPQVLASHKDLIDVARCYRDSEVLKGWRYEIVGADLLDFMEGRTRLSIRGGTLQVTNRE